LVRVLHVGRRPPSSTLQRLKLIGMRRAAIACNMGGPAILSGDRRYWCRWGLVPSFTKPEEKPDFWRMVRAARGRSWRLSKPLHGRAVQAKQALFALCATPHAAPCPLTPSSTLAARA
jgi:hypothetical protein